GAVPAQNEQDVAAEGAGGERRLRVVVGIVVGTAKPAVDGRSARRRQRADVDERARAGRERIGEEFTAGARDGNVHDVGRSIRGTHGHRRREHVRVRNRGDGNRVGGGAG